MTVAALESLGLVFNLGSTIQQAIDINLFVLLLGAGSAIIDNVPLVAASMGMFDLDLDNPGMAFYSLLCWNRWKHAYYRFSGRCCCHGNGKNIIFLVF